MDRFIEECNERRLHFMKSCWVSITTDELTEEKWRTFWNNYCQIRKRKNKINKLKREIWIQNGM
jgi:hypothetical protein